MTTHSDPLFQQSLHTRPLLTHLPTKKLQKLLFLPALLDFPRKSAKIVSETQSPTRNFFHHRNRAASTTDRLRAALRLRPINNTAAQEPERSKFISRHLSAPVLHENSAHQPRDQLRESELCAGALPTNCNKRACPSLATGEIELAFRNSRLNVPRPIWPLEDARADPRLILRLPRFYYERRR